MDLMKMMKQAQNLQKRIKEVQDELAAKKLLQKLKVEMLKLLVLVKEGLSQ